MRLGPTCKVYGIDPEAAIERTKFKLRYISVQNVELVEGVAERMPFGNNYFDLIVSNNGLNNVQDLAKTLNECSRVSRPGSQFVFTFNTDRTFAGFYDVFREVLIESSLTRIVREIDDHIYEKRKPVAEYKKMLEQIELSYHWLYEDEFDFKFSDATAMFNHFFMRIFVTAGRNWFPAI